MRGIVKIVMALPLAAALMVAAGCDKAEEPEAREPETVRERAERVGEFGDRTMTKNLKKNLVGAVDSAAENEERLKEANELSDN